MSQDLPCSPGILWKMEGKKFEKHIMAPNTSYPALQWLQYCQDYDPQLLNDDGSRSKIEHYYFRGESVVAGTEVDGHAQIIKNGQTKNIFYEFQGCR